MALRPLFHDGVPGRPARDPERLLRGRTHGRRPCTPPFPPHHAPAPDADHLLRCRGIGAAVGPHLPDALHHHRRRSRQRDARTFHADLRDRILVHEDGSGRRDLSGAVRHHDGVHLPANAHLHETRAVLTTMHHSRKVRLWPPRLRAVSRHWLGLALLLTLTLAFIFPILWMV